MLQSASARPDSEGWCALPAAVPPTCPLLGEGDCLQWSCLKKRSSTTKRSATVQSVASLAQSTSQSRWPALVVLCAGMLMIILDQTVVNVALPSIQRDLGFSQSSLAWVVNAYLIPFGGLLLLAGRLGDLIGRKRIMLAGLLVFTAGSALCGLSQSQLMLVVARFVQGIGGAMASALILGMIVALFPEPREQARAIGVFSFVAAAGGAIGLLAGGVLTQAINWHWIFFVNLPIGLAAVVLAMRLLQSAPGLGLAAGADLPGAVLITSSLMLGVYTIVGEAADNGWSSARTLVFGVASLLLFVAFIARQATQARPLLPLGIFKSRNLSGANLVQMLMVAAMFGMFFLGSLYLQRVLLYDALQIGLAFLPVAIVIGAFSIEIAARLAGRFGARNVLLCGLTFILGGLAMFAVAPVDAQYVPQILPAMALLGLGGGLSFPSLMTLAMSGATADDAGLTSGLVNTTAQVGGSLGLAVLATLSTARTQNLLADGASLNVALTGGFHLAFGVGAGLIVLAMALAATLLNRAQASQ
ncbi:MAG: DHA2 family efflux MFS transporter permease subunit, partial [Chloroflexi bacterium]|nr:DHA2 family efflux MFS transporter permease subunit [Chloroflexota bacterium]